MQVGKWVPIDVLAIEVSTTNAILLFRIEFGAFNAHVSTTLLFGMYLFFRKQLVTIHQVKIIDEPARVRQYGRDHVSWFDFNGMVGPRQFEVKGEIPPQVVGLDDGHHVLQSVDKKIGWLYRHQTDIRRRAQSECRLDSDDP